MYGYFANAYSPMCDVELAESITKTGQATVKEAGSIVNKFGQEKFGISEKEELLIYSDTDSCYITIEPIIQKLGIEFSTNGIIHPKVYELAEEIQTLLNHDIKIWGSRTLNSTDCRFVFKRETICEVGIFLRKKRYILHILDKNGIPTNKIKYVGVDIVSSSTPKRVKPLLKKVAEAMIYSKNENTTNEVLREVYKEFKTFGPDDLSVIKNIQNYDKYARGMTGFNIPKGCPIHSKSAMYYNRLLDYYGIAHKYEKIKSGTKIKYFYVEPNKFAINTVGFLNKYPNEFELKINYDVMFEKTVIAAARRLYEAVNWRICKPTNEKRVDLIKLLS